MISAPIPDDEEQRLEALRDCGILDTEPEPTFEEIAALAGQLCATPMALVSLVDTDRQWFKARVGLRASETSRDVSFCAYSVALREPLLVPDTLADIRFADNPLVTDDPAIRFYAGVPLVLEDGHAVGTLCVLDRVPRELSAAQFKSLSLLARQVSVELGLRRRLQSANAHLGRASGLGASEAQIRDGAVIARRYRIERLIGAGGMGVVAAAEDTQTRRPVAIKFLLRHQGADAGMLDRFIREAKALLRMDCEHVVRVLDVGNLSNGAPFIVMERLVGEDLGARLARLGPLPADEVIDAVVQACAAAASAHACGVLHRDLKPDNLFLTRREDGGTLVKVLDFGVSKLVEGEGFAASAALTEVSSMIGSVYYMSPEQMQNAQDIDGRTDLWSLGVTMYELLTGVLPFQGETVAEVCAQVLMKDPVPVHSLRPDVPALLGAVISRCLGREREARPASAAELARALAECRCG